MTFIKIPHKGIPVDLRKEIENSLPAPLKVPGWEFDDYVWRKLTQVNTKDKEGFTDNSVRLGGTGENDTLFLSLKRGIDISELTPSIYGDDNLLNGFNRQKQLLAVGYKEWIFAKYKIDESTKTEFQTEHQEFIDDFRAAANKGNGTKVITDAEVEELARKRFENRTYPKGKVKDKIMDYIKSLDLNLSGNKIAGIANKISRDSERRGVIDSYTRTEAEEYLNKYGIGADVLNTHGTEGDMTRVLRLYVQIMQNFNSNESTLSVALFDSQATTHESVDDHRENTIKLLKELDKEVIQYASKRLNNIEIPAWDILGAIPQKVGVDKQEIDGLVPLL